MNVDTPKLRLRFIPGYPLSIALGGFEHQCVQTCRALAALGCDARILDWNDSEDKFDVLHFFGALPAWEHLAEQVKHRMPYVVSALYQSHWAGTARRVNRAVESLTALFRQTTQNGSVRRVLASASAVICLNESQRLATAARFGLDSQHVHAIPNGVPDSRFCGDPGLFQSQYGVRDYVLFVGNIIPRKSPLLLAQTLHKRGWRGIFLGGTVASDLPYAERFRAFVKDATGLQWIPALDYNSPLLDSAFAGAKAFCLPSLSEGQPLAAMEALAARTPVIMPDLPYARLSPFENTVRYDPANPAGLESALERVLGCPDSFRGTLSREYSWDSVARRLLCIYSGALGRRENENR